MSKATMVVGAILLLGLTFIGYAMSMPLGLGSLPSAMMIKKTSTGGGAMRLAPAGVVPNCNPTWQFNNPNPNPSENGFFGVAAVSANDVWVSGGGYFSGAHIEHWDGSGWSLIPNPAQPDGALGAMSALSSDDIWDVGVDTGSDTTLAAHWDGTQWSIVPSPTPYGDAIFYGVTAISHNNVWAVGSYLLPNGQGGAVQQTLVEHWDGQKWQVVPSPNFGDDANELHAVAAVSPDDIWAVGLWRTYNGITTVYLPITMHWDGVDWQMVDNPNTGAREKILKGLTAIAHNDIWAVGGYADDPGGHPMVFHWNGVVWKDAPIPDPGTWGNGLQGATAISSNDVWAVGNYYPGSGPTYRTLTEHWDGGAWQVVASPSVEGYINNLHAVSAVNSNDVWAGGRYYSFRGSVPIVMHYSVPDICPTLTPTSAPTATASPTDTATPSATTTPTPSPFAATVTPTNTPLPLATATPTASPTPCAAQYRDVGVEYWAYGYIHYLACRGVTAGYPDGSFRPATPISRAEFSKLLALAYGLPLTSPPTPRFSDVPPNHWAYSYIEALAAANISVGYPDGTYRPNASISRSELVKLTVLASGAPPYTGPYTDYPDVPPSHWAYQYIKTATHRGWVGGYADGFFRPNAPSSRAELAKLLYLALTFPRR